MCERLIRTIAALGALVALGGCSLAPFGEPRTPPELMTAAKALTANDSDRAIALFNSVIRAKPRDLATYAQIADLCIRKGRGELVVRYAEQGIAVAPKDDLRARAELYLLASSGYELTGDFDSMVRSSQEAYKLWPDDPVTLNGLGYRLAIANRDLDEALRLTTRAVELARKQSQPDAAMGAIVDSLGWVHFKLGHNDEAIRYLTSAADLAPDQWEIHDHLSQVYMAIGNTKDARIERDRANNLREAEKLKDK